MANEVKEAEKKADDLATELGDSELKLRPDWGAIKSIYKDFVAEAAKVSKEAALAVLKHQGNINDTIQKAKSGELDGTAARRAKSRDEAAIQNYFAGVKENLNWGVADSYKEATDQLLNWALVLGSKLIARI